MPVYKLGQKLVLWKCRYTDSAQIVEEQVPVTIVEVRNDVPGMFKPERLHNGFKAKSDTGEEFLFNWHAYPDDVLDPFYWGPKPDKNGKLVIEVVDGIRAYNSKSYNPYLNKDLTRAFPLNAQICPTHQFAHLPDTQCHRCFFEEILAQPK